MYFNPYALLLYFAGIVLLILAYKAWWFRYAPGAKGFIFLAFCCSIYTFFYALEISSSSLDKMLLWIKFEYIGIALIPAAYLLFALGYTGKIRLLPSPLKTAIFIIPMVTILLIWTNDIHQLIYRTVTLDTEGPFPVISFEPGTWYWIHNGYTILTILYCTILFAMMWAQSASVYRKQLATMLTGSLLPFAALLFYLTRPISWSIDFNPFIFLFSGLFFFWGLVRLRLFDLIPIARAKLFEKLPDGIIFLDARQRIIDLNKTSKTYLSLSKGSIGKPVAEELDYWPELAAALLKYAGKNRLELPRVISGKKHWFRIDVLTMQEREVHYGQMILVHDITDRKKAEEKLQLLATTDELTGLWNRRHFTQSAELEVKRAQRYKHSFSLLMIDIDHFKRINDTAGHSAGDRTLQHLASLLKGRLRKNDMAGRIGGDEFCILLPNTDLESAYQLAEVLGQKIMTSPLKYDGFSIEFTVSIGVAAYQPGINCIDDMLKKADAAMYRAKTKGRNRTMK